MIRKLLIGLVLAGSLVGCQTDYPATGEDDRGVVAPDKISTIESEKDAPVVPWYNPWWNNK